MASRRPGPGRARRARACSLNRRRRTCSVRRRIRSRSSLTASRLRAASVLVYKVLCYAARGPARCLAAALAAARACAAHCGRLARARGWRGGRWRAGRRGLRRQRRALPHAALALEERPVLDHEPRRDQRRLHARSRRAARCAGARAPGPVTLPRIETTPQSISASTWPVSPMISVLSETIAALEAPVDAEGVAEAQLARELRAVVQEAVEVLGRADP